MGEPVTSVAPDTAYVRYALAWLCFAVSHSWLAGASIKARLASALGPYYRLAYNVVALISFLAVMFVGAWAFGGGKPVAPFDQWQFPLTVLSVLGWGVLILALRTYDLGRFSGLAQIRAHKEGRALDEDETLITTGFHAYMRHPIYTAAFMILWGAAWTDLGLATAWFGTMYLIVGARFEERRLIRLYGQDYRDYRKRVPAFIPWRGRVDGSE